MKLVFCNIGWMEYYDGLHRGDKLRGGGRYPRATGKGSEVCNFTPHRGFLYGFVQVKGSIDLERISEIRRPEPSSYITGVTVVWTASHPVHKKTVIVGWYRNATIFRDYVQFSKEPRKQEENGVHGFRIKAPDNRAKLLSIDERVITVPRKKKGYMGQSNIWYADQPQAAKFLKRVKELIAIGPSARTMIVESKIRPARRGARSQDQDRKTKVEQNAIRVCWDHFVSLGYIVSSVEKDNRGWDLEATNKTTELRIEVKGLSGSEIQVEMTPNEYTALKKRERNYRLAVVVDALQRKPSLFLCRYSHERRAWIVEGGDRTIEITEKTGARIRASIP